MQPHFRKTKIISGAGVLSVLLLIVILAVSIPRGDDSTEPTPKAGIVQKFFVTYGADVKACFAK